MLSRALRRVGISISSVKIRLHRARMTLQKNLAPQLKQVAPKRGVVRMVIECKHVWAHISGYLDQTAFKASVKQFNPL